jgi:hypothetical protein
MASWSAFRQGLAGMVASSSNGPFNMLLSSPLAQWISLGLVFVGTAFPEMYRTTLQKAVQELWPALVSGYKPAIAPSGNNVHAATANVATTDSDWMLRQVHWWHDLATRNSKKVIAGLSLAAAGLVLIYRL